MLTRRSLVAGAITIPVALAWNAASIDATAVAVVSGRSDEDIARDEDFWADVARAGL
jgi:hypothetical protein